MFGSLKLYAALAGILAMAGGGWYLHHKGYAAGVASQAARVQALQDAATTNQESIAKLEQANAQFKAQCQANLKAAKDEASAAMQHADHLQAQVKAAQAKLGNLYATSPKAKAWADTAVPAAVSQAIKGAQQ